MEIRPTIITVADYCAMFEDRKVSVNRNYQRSDQVWPSAARSFLIETILLGYPIPKLSLHQRTDLRSRQTIKEVVDGQQRTRAIYDFYKDEYRLSRACEVEDAAGRSYEELPEELQQTFLDYGLNFDLFVSVTDEEVREVFRRMNSFTIPLNPEEHRNATFQGPFKWFVRRITSDYDQAFLAAGVFTQKQLVRMQDSKLITEISCAYFEGIATTNKQRLDRAYREHDVEFSEEEDLERRLRSALDRVLGWEELAETSLMKPYAVYSLVLAVMHLEQPLEHLQETFDASTADVAADDDVVVELTRLADAFDRDEVRGPFGAFVKASAEKTNTRAQRAERFRWFCLALTGQLPE